MKKVLCLLLAAVCMFCLANQASAKVVIKLSNAGPNNPDNRTVKAVEIFKAMVEKGTQGEVEVQAFHASALGNERESLEGVKMGTIQMATLSSGPVAGFFSPVMVLGIPYLFSSAPAAWDAYNGEFGQAFAEAFQKQTGVRILGLTENGYRHFTNNTREIKAPQDMKGLKIRTMGLESHKTVVSSMGGQPVAINWAEVYTSLQTGVADGQMNPIPIVKFAKFDEVQKYMTLTNHLFTPYVWIMNKSAFDGLSAQEKEVVKAAAESAIVACRGINRIIEASERGLPALAQKMQIYTPTKAEIAKFRELAQPAVKAQIAKSYGKEGETLMADFLAAIDKAAK